MTYRSCSWCHATNQMTGGPVFCRDCGHRADVPRLDCDCPRCRQLAYPPTEPDPPADMTDTGRPW